MLKQTVLFALGFILMSLNLFSQDTIGVKSKPKNEIAIDASPILGGLIRNTALPGLFYRRHFDNKAFRVKINFNFDKSDFNNRRNQNSFTSSPRPGSSKTYQVDYSLGLQKGKEISEKLRFYYGLDLIFGNTSYNYLREDQNETYNGTDMTYTIITTRNEATSKSIYGGISPFLGFTWQITSQLGLSIEASVPVAYYKSYNTSVTFVHSSSNSVETSYSNNSDYYNFKAKIAPVSNFLISYHF